MNLGQCRPGCRNVAEGPNRRLEQRATRAGEPFVPFDIDTDYPRYVDGKVFEFVSGTTRVFRLNDDATL
jgi:hypothetical protein